MSEPKRGILGIVREGVREVKKDAQQRADGYSHTRGDDSGDEPDHTPPGSPECGRNGRKNTVTVDRKRCCYAYVVNRNDGRTACLLAGRPPFLLWRRLWLWGV